MRLEHLIDPLLRITEEACSAIMEIYDRFQPGDEIRKTDNSPLTFADKRSHEIIVSGLRALTPGMGIISEEHKNLDYDVRKNLDYIWCVDPLDGTKEFIKKNGEFTTNIALIQDQRPILGVIGVPAQGYQCYAYQGGGAYKVVNGQRIPLRANRFSMSDRGLRLVASRSHLNEATQEFANQLQDVSFVSQGSSLKFLILADQGADIYPRLAPTMEWDTAAAQCVLEEAGGLVLRHDNREPMRYNKPSLTNPHFIAFGDVQDLEQWQEKL